MKPTQAEAIGEAVVLGLISNSFLEGVYHTKAVTTEIEQDLTKFAQYFYNQGEVDTLNARLLLEAVSLVEKLLSAPDDRSSETEAGAKQLVDRLKHHIRHHGGTT